MSEKNLRSRYSTIFSVISCSVASLAPGHPLQCHPICRTPESYLQWKLHMPPRRLWNFWQSLMRHCHSTHLLASHASSTLKPIRWCLPWCHQPCKIAMSALGPFATSASMPCSSSVVPHQLLPCHRAHRPNPEHPNMPHKLLQVSVSCWPAFDSDEKSKCLKELVLLDFHIDSNFGFPLFFFKDQKSLN